MPPWRIQVTVIHNLFSPYFAHNPILMTTHSWPPIGCHEPTQIAESIDALFESRNIEQPHQGCGVFHRGWQQGWQRARPDAYGRPSASSTREHDAHVTHKQAAHDVSGGSFIPSRVRVSPRSCHTLAEELGAGIPILPEEAAIASSRLPSIRSQSFEHSLRHEALHPLSHSQRYGCSAFLFFFFFFCC